MNKPLPPDWEAIADDMYEGKIGHYAGVNRLYTLATKPPKELTDAEIDDLSVKWFGPLRDDPREDAVLNTERLYARELIAAHIRKQSEPEQARKGKGRDLRHEF